MASRSSMVIISSSPIAKVGGLLTLTIAESNGTWLLFSFASVPLAPKCDSHLFGDWPPNLVITMGGTGSLLYYTKHDCSHCCRKHLDLHGLVLSDGCGLSVSDDFDAHAPEADVTNHNDSLAKGIIDGPRPIGNRGVTSVNGVVRLLPLVRAKAAPRGRRQAVGLHIIKRDVVARRITGFEQLDRPAGLCDELAANAHLDMLGGTPAVEAMVGVPRVSNDLLVLFEPGVEAVECECNEPG